MRAGKSIKAIRTARRWTQAALAAELDVSKNYVSMLENDARDPSWSFMVRLSEVTKTPLPLILALSLPNHELDRITTRLLDLNTLIQDGSRADAAD